MSTCIGAWCWQGAERLYLSFKKVASVYSHFIYIYSIGCEGMDSMVCCYVWYQRQRFFEIISIDIHSYSSKRNIEQNVLKQRTTKLLTRKKNWDSN